MVFLSTLQALVGRPTRSVFRFGTRPLTQRLLLNELSSGMFVVAPLACLIALITTRFCMKQPYIHRFVRSDIVTTIVITLVGDLFLELLLPSLQCVPLLPPFLADTDASIASSYLTWLMQSWGITCPDTVTANMLLSTDAVGTILTIRLIFLCIGVYLGESVHPIALTGGIASGKSTVASFLLRNDQQPQDEAVTVPIGKRKLGKKKKQQQPSFFLEEPQEGTVQLIDADQIAHEILLPRSVLEDDTDNDENNKYCIQHYDSVYENVRAAFQDYDILVDHTATSAGATSPTAANDISTHDDDEDVLIDRTKLGAVIFADPALRRELNRLMHSKILYILLRQILYGSFWATADLIIVDVPLLFESGLLKYIFSAIVVVHSSEELQFKRLQERNPELSKQQCVDRLRSQLPLSQKVVQADLLVDNSGDLQELANAVETIRRDLMGRAYGIGMSLLQMLLLVGGSLSLAVSSKLFTTSWS